jgi:hypothetical protein
MDRDVLEERLLDFEHGAKKSIRNLRFSIRGMLAVVLLAGIVLAGVRDHPDPFSAALGSAFALTVFGVLCTSILGVLFKQGRQRAFWTGFAVFGWAFSVLGLAIQIRPPAFILAILPFAYLGGLIARGFAARDDGP